MTFVETALLDVRRERDRQDQKWGAQNHSLAIWLAILAEEFGEASKEINEFHFRDQSVDRVWNVRDELIQTAAVAVAMVEYIDRHTITELRETEGK